MKRWLNLATLAKRQPRVGLTPADVVHHENKWKLLRYRRAPDVKPLSTPIVMVPSLINRHYVLDLMPGKSMVEYLVGRGHDVFVIDWGTPGPEDRFLDFDTITDRYIGRALSVASRKAGTARAHLFGYCLGGTLTAIHAAARPERVATLMALAAPIDFSDDGLLSTWTRTKSFDLEALVSAFGNVPWQLMQASFHMLRPTLNLSKSVHLLDRAWDDQFLDGFLALEKWGNDNVSFPGECYRRYIQELYRDNALVAGSFTLSGRPARLENIRCPTLAVTFEHDNIVPWKSAAALVEHAGAEDKDRLHLAGGHVGAVVSRKASKGLWPTLSKWWSERDALGTSA